MSTSIWDVRILGTGAMTSRAEATLLLQPADIIITDYLWFTLLAADGTTIASTSGWFISATGTIVAALGIALVGAVMAGRVVLLLGSLSGLLCLSLASINGTAMLFRRAVSKSEAWLSTTAHRTISMTTGGSFRSTSRSSGAGRGAGRALT